jgi:hypothetical protein
LLHGIIPTGPRGRASNFRAALSKGLTDIILRVTVAFCPRQSKANNPKNNIMILIFFDKLQDLSIEASPNYEWAIMNH